MVKLARTLLGKVDNQLPPLVQSPPMVVVVEPNHNHHSTHRSLETLVVVLAVITIVAVIAGIIARLCKSCIDGGVSAAPSPLPTPEESKPATEAPKPATEAKK